MTNLILGLIAAMLWGGAYGAYFAPELRAWWRRRRGLPPTRRAYVVPQRMRPLRPRAVPAIVARPAPPRPATPTASNVIPFPRRPPPR